MSDFRAIGGVSATLQTLLVDRMELPDSVASVPVTIGPPPFSVQDNNPHQESLRVNLFLYRVSENGFLQNQEIPGRSGSHGAFGHPPLSLNLHYLITAHGNVQKNGDNDPFFDDTRAQWLLGSAMRVLHDAPIITDTLFTQRAPSGTIILHESLRNEYERIKITLEPLTLEDLTKLWTALTLRMRLAAPYTVNVVQIESRRPRSFPRPVGQPASWAAPPLPVDPPAPGPMVVVLPMRSPTITTVAVRRAGTTTENPLPYARIGDMLVLHGTSLSREATSVAFGDVTVPASYADATRVEAAIPDATIPGAGAIPPALLLQPGVLGAKVIARDPRVPGGNFSSNEAPFMLVPQVYPAAIAYAAGLPRQITVNGTRLAAAAPRGQTMIGHVTVPATDYVSATPTQIVVPIPDTLPASGVQCLLGAPLNDPVVVGAEQAFNIKIAGVEQTVKPLLPNSLPRADAAAMVMACIHDAAPNGDLHYLGTRVELWHDRLLIVPGGLTSALSVTSAVGSTLAADLGLVVAQPPGAGSASISGTLASPPVLSAALPRISLAIGAQPAVMVPVGAAASLAAFADALQAAIQAASGAPEYRLAQVALSGYQLLLIPGAPGLVKFSAAPGDDTSVVELQLHARFAVRVRVNDAESIDDATVELPQ